MGSGEVDGIVNLIYEGDGFPIIISRQRLTELPFDIGLSPDSGRVLVVPGEVGGHTAVFQQAAPGSEFQTQLVVRFISADHIMTSVQWRATGSRGSAAEFNEVLRIAESLAD